MTNNQKDLRYEIESRVVEGAVDNGIRKTDEHGNLECFCSDNPPFNDFERKIRGYIFDGDNLILKSIKYGVSYNPLYDIKGSDLNMTSDPKDVGDISDYKVTIMKEGTCIRVFNYQEKWYTTTHRKINAFKSKWGKESFGDIFEENIKCKTNLDLNSFYMTLDIDKSYVFLVGTTDVTRTVSPKYNDVYLIECNDKYGNLVKSESLKDWYLPEIKFDNLESAVQYTESLKYPFEDGYGVFLSSENKNFKIINSEYEKLSGLRNNLPSIPFAYLHNVFDKEKNKSFRNLYKNFTSEFDNYDLELKTIAYDLLKKYINRFVKKEQFTIPKHEHNILYHVHGIYLKNKDIIRIEHIFEAFKLVPPSNINKIIFERKQQKKLNNKN